ncbi:MAG: hypothetical protein ACI8XO_000539 [Verrucomicrobiales bacterium]|jgi:hypothetical protein
MAKAIIPTIAFMLLVSAALACKVPVFRYALDRWTGSEYVLKADGDHQLGTANLKLANGKGELFAPFDDTEPIWTGEVDEKALGTLLNSPQRKEIVKQILAGASAVWVIVESGDKKADDEVFERLNDRLTFFQSVAQLPEIDPDDPASQLGPGPELELKFSILRMKRDDPREALLVRMLAGPKLDALEAGKPFVAPVFGQGRVLGAWPAEMMDAEGIEEACFFLTGACSCQVKAQNPGWDLLLSADWEKGLLAADQKKKDATEKEGEK